MMHKVTHSIHVFSPKCIRLSMGGEDLLTGSIVLYLGKYGTVLMLDILLEVLTAVCYTQRS
jgi:hypothetical protein